LSLLGLLSVAGLPRGVYSFDFVQMTHPYCYWEAGEASRSNLGYCHAPLAITCGTTAGWFQAMWLLATI